MEDLIRIAYGVEADKCSAGRVGSTQTDSTWSPWPRPARRRKRSSSFP